MLDWIWQDRRFRPGHVGRIRAPFGFLGINHQPSSDIGLELGGDTPQWGRESNRLCSENTDSSYSG
jgi:hypothetical protein